jgi:hypothetical protein
LQAAVIALAGQQIHLQEALIRLHLNFNQVGNLNRRLNFCKIKTLTFPDVLIARGHCVIYLILSSFDLAEAGIQFGHCVELRRKDT